MTYNLMMIRNGLAEKTTLPKKKKPLKKISDKLKAEREKNKIALNGDDTEKVKFFKRCIKQMKGRCVETGERTETGNYQYAIRSICHILSQNHCPSVATHPCVWIELDADFHVAFDAMSWREREMLKCWPEIKQKLIMLYDSIAGDEKRHFPDFVLEEMRKHEPF